MNLGRAFYVQRGYQGHIYQVGDAVPNNYQLEGWLDGMELFDNNHQLIAGMGTFLPNYNVNVPCDAVMDIGYHYFTKDGKEICRGPLTKIEAFHVLFK